MAITQEYLKTVINYNKNTGEFIWLKDMGKNKVKNKPCGTKTNNYISIRINKKLYYAHRLAWLYEYGTWPKHQIDHINGIRDDNRIENLRNVTSRENSQNRQIHRNGFICGSALDKRTGRYQACYKYNGKTRHIGNFSTKEEATIAYNNKIKELGL